MSVGLMSTRKRFSKLRGIGLLILREFDLLTLHNLQWSNFSFSLRLSSYTVCAVINHVKMLIIMTLFLGIVNFISTQTKSLELSVENCLCLPFCLL